MKQFIIRPAINTECRTIAELYSISSDGVADYIWTKMSQPGENIIDVGTRRYQQEDSAFSYRNCSVVEIDGQVAGMLVTFPMYVDPDKPEEEDPVLAPSSRLEEDNSYYICGMALFPEYRKQHIGTALLRKAEDQAIDRGFNKLSLICFAQNSIAFNLYKKNGFKEKMRELIVPHPLIHYIGDAVLMVKHI